MLKKLHVNSATLKKFLIVCISSEFIYYVYAIRNTLYTPYREMLGLSNTQLGMVLTIMGWVAFFGGIPSAWVLNRFSARKLQAINLSLSGLTCFYMISGKVTYAGMLVVGVIWGFTLEAFYWGAVTKSVRCMFADDRQGIAFGSMEMTRGLTNVIENMIFVSVFAWMGETLFGMRVIMGIVGILLILMAVGVWVLLPEEEYLHSVTHTGKNKESLKGAIACLKIPQLWLAGFMGMGVYAVYIGTSYFQPFLEDIFNVPTILVSIFAIVSTSYVRMFAGPVSGVIGNKVFKSTAYWMRILFAIGVLMLIGIVASPKTAGMVWTVTILLVVLQVVVFMLRGVYYAPIGESGIPREVSGSAMAIAILLIQSPMCWAYVVYAALIDRYNSTIVGYKWMFIVMACLYGVGFIASSILIAVIKKRGLKVNVAVKAEDKKTSTMTD